MENKSKILSRYLSPDALEMVENNYLTKSDNAQRRYWSKRILMRIDELKPLVNECIEKNVSLQELDSDINNEWNNLISLRNRFIV